MATPLGTDAAGSSSASTAAVPTPSAVATKVHKAIDPVIDLGNLLLTDLDPLSLDSLQLRCGSDADIERGLADLCRDNVQCLINRVWQLPTERAEDVMVAELPAPSTLVAREKPLPKPKAPSKWDEYARLKGIQKRKRSRMVWDDVSRTWKPRWGYGRARDDTQDWVVEIPDNQDPYKDYIGERLEAKKERVDKNELQRLRNIARSRGQPVAHRGAQKAAPLVGVEPTPLEERKADQLARQAMVAQRSTASVGKFTEELAGQKRPKNAGKTHKFQPNTGNMATERSSQMQLLKRLESKQPKLNVAKAIAGSAKSKREAAKSRGDDDDDDEGGAGGGGRKKPKVKGSRRRNSLHTKNKQKFKQNKGNRSKKQ